MKILDANTLVGTSVEGTRGSLTYMPAIEEGLFGAQMIIVPPNTKAPKPGQRCSDKTFLFVLQGSATLSNGEFYQKITPGQMVVLEKGEERVLQTEKEKFLCLEVRIGAPPPTEPATVQNVLFEPVAAPAVEAPKKSVSVYDEI